MKFIIVFAALCALAIAAPPPSQVEIVSRSSDVGPESYQYSYATSDGTQAQEAGQLNNIGSENEAIAVRGSFQYVGDDGQTYQVQYVADENGFQPQGAHLPVA